METCQRCKEEDDDRRTLWMSCFYDMDELGIPFEVKRMEWTVPPASHKGVTNDYFTLRVCKSCRADWMNQIRNWFNNVYKRPSCGSGIYIKHFGDNIEITREEWDAMQKDKGN